MKVRKIIILGIDAIEYDFVEEWDLKNLKQEEYGKIILPLLSGQEPATEIIWPCFITGKEPEEMGYSSVNIFVKPIKPITNFFILLIKLLFKDIKKKDKTQKNYGNQSILSRFIMLLKKVGLIHKPTKEDIKSETLFDNKKIKSVHLHITVIDNDDFPEYRKDIIKAISKKEHIQAIEMKQKRSLKID